MSFAITLGIGVVALGIGAAVGYFYRKQLAQKNADSIEAIAEKRMVELKNKEQEILLEAKKESIRIIDGAKKDEEDRRAEIKKMQERVEQRENMFDKQLLSFEEEKTKLQGKVDEL